MESYVSIFTRTIPPGLQHITGQRNHRSSSVWRSDFCFRLCLLRVVPHQLPSQNEFPEHAEFSEHAACSEPAMGVSPSRLFVVPVEFIIRHHASIPASRHADVRFCLSLHGN